MKILLNLSIPLLLAVCFIGCDEDTLNEHSNDIPLLTQEEIDGLKYMKEEEKLARDVYRYFYEVYQLELFDNISNSEQKHIDRIVGLMGAFNVDDTSVLESGKFSNQHLQDLYNLLIEKGNISLVDALKVGLTIEDVDIFDLEQFSSKVVQDDIEDVYEKLNCGSRNHMRAFNDQLLKHNSVYIAQYISQTRFDEIVDSSNEKCGKK